MKILPITLILTLLFLPLSLIASDYHVQIIGKSADQVHLKITFDEPSFMTEGDFRYAFYKKAALIKSENGALVPHIVQFFNLPIEEKTDPQIIKMESRSLPVPDYLLTAQSEPDQAFDIKQTVSAQYLGNYRGTPLHALHVLPVEYDPATKTIVWLTAIELKVVIPKAKRLQTVQSRAGSEMLSGLLVDKDSKMYQPATALSKAAGSAASGYKLNPILNKQKIYKIAVVKTGLYKITYQDLADAGYPVQDVNPERLSLYFKGVEVPVYFSGSEDNSFDVGDYFEFWGEKNEKTFLKQFPDVYADPFSDVSVYWLVENTINGRRLVEESGGLSQSGVTPVFEPYAFTETLHFEENKFHENFGHSSSNLNRPSHEIDHWYYDSGIRAPEGGAYNFHLPHPFETGARVVVKAALRGKSFYSYPTNLLQGHKVELKLRGKDDIAKRIGIINPADRWRDQTMRFITNADSVNKISQSLLKHGTNRLEIDMFQTGVTDIVLLNWFEITYLRKYRADNNYIKFSVDANFFDGQYVKLGNALQFNVDGFETTDIELYKLGVSKIVDSQLERITQDLITSYRITFQDEVFDTDVQYVALTEAQKLKPASIKAYTAWSAESSGINILSSSNKTDYLIITTDLLYQQALQLKNIKTEAGLRPEVVKVENIYDVFNFGTKSPLAIKDFIRYVYEEWDQLIPLKYVVLAGDASYDYKGVIKAGADMVPTIMYQTEQFGAAASDYWYALMDDDYIPDISVSRIPANTTQQFSYYLDKILKYDTQSGASEWRNSALFISGNDASSSDRELGSNLPIFRGQSLRLMQMQLPGPVFAHRLNTVKDENVEGFDPNFGSTTDLIEYFDDGVSFINFLGHGGGAIWADVNLLNLNDIDRLNNGDKLPFIASMTCFTGAFENPGRQGLAEKLLLSEDKGAIAIMSSSGLGWKYNDLALEWGLLDFLWDENLTFGEAVDLMKIYYLSNPVYYIENDTYYTLGYHTLYKSMVTQYNLFGDPALKLQKADGMLKVSSDNYSPMPGETIRIHLSGGIASGQGRAELVDQQNIRLFNNSFAYQSSGTELEITLPDSLPAQMLRFKAYATSGSQDASGSIDLGLQKAIVRKIVVTPVKPKVGEAISFEIIVDNSKEIESVKLFEFRDSNNNNPLQGQVTTQKISDTLFVSDADYPGFASSGKKYFNVLIRDKDGVETISYHRSMHVFDERPDLKLVENSLQYTGTSQLQLKFSVLNDSDTDLTGVKVACYTNAGIDDDLPFAEQSISIKAHEQKEVYVLFDSVRFVEQRRFKIWVDSDERFAERSESNNIILKTLETDHLLIRPNLGTTIGGLTNEPVVLQKNWQLFIPKDSLSVSSVVKFRETDITAQLQESAQAGLIPVKPGQAMNFSAADISIPNYSENLKFQAVLSAEFNTSIDSMAQLSYYRFNGFLNLWVRFPSTVDENRVSATVRQPGKYAVFYNTDDREPLIEISSNGRPLIQDILVVSQPTLSILLQDESGINLNNSFNLKLDGEPLVRNGIPLNDSEVNFPDSLQNAKAISIVATPKLSPGSHTLDVEIADVNGNLSKEQISFQVSDGFEIRVYGNYPNPFEEKTIISFYINSDNEIDDLTVKIYSTSGRLVRSKMLDLDETIATDNIRLPAFHELTWFGDDDDGRQVANGVYFAVVTGKYRGKTVKHTLKMAKLQ